MFRRITSVNGFLKNFYAQLKRCAVEDGVIARVFITGVTSISLDSITSGFSVSEDFTHDPAFSDLYGFMVYCKEELKNNTATRARKTSTLRLFFKYMSVQTHRLDSNPADLLEAPKIKQSLPKYLSLEDSLELLNSVDGENGRRDYCILTIFLNCGLRLSELCGLDLSDISSDGTMTVTGKGNKERMVYLNDSCKTAIKRLKTPKLY